MSLETYGDVGDLYRARGKDVNSRRPIFSGDVFADVPIAGVQGRGAAIVVAHPCSMRGRNAQLSETVLAAAVGERARVGPGAWTRGLYHETPIPELTGADLHVGRFDDLGRAAVSDLLRCERLACLSVLGVNLLQQRLIWYLTRFEVPTARLYEAFAHTFEEADLLEDWNDIVCEAGMAEAQSAATFDEYIRRDDGAGRTLQNDLRDPQRRPAVRTACRAESRQVAARFVAAGT